MGLYSSKGFLVHLYSEAFIRGARADKQGGLFSGFYVILYNTELKKFCLTPNNSIANGWMFLWWIVTDLSLLSKIISNQTETKYLISRNFVGKKWWNFRQVTKIFTWSFLRDVWPLIVTKFLRTKIFVDENFNRRSFCP